MDDGMFHYPFLFEVHKTEAVKVDDGSYSDLDHYVVVIAHPWDLKLARTYWMNDPDLPQDRTFEPDIDLMESKHIFPGTSKGAYEALKFIKEWWAQHKLSFNPADYQG